MVKAGLDAIDDAAVSTSNNITAAFLKSRRLETTSLKQQMDYIERQEKKSRLFIERRKAAFMQNLKGRRREWWKFDNHVRDTVRKDFDNIILRRTNDTILSNYKNNNNDNTTGNNGNKTIDKTNEDEYSGRDFLKSENASISTFDEKKSMHSKLTKNTIESILSVKLPSIISKLSHHSVRESPDYYNVNSELNKSYNKLPKISRLTNNSVLDSSKLSNYSDVRTTTKLRKKKDKYNQFENDSMVLSTITSLPKITAKTRASMSRLERQECLEYIKLSGYLNYDEEAFYNSTHRFLNRTPYYMESRDYIRKCVSEQLFRSKCLDRERQHLDKRDDRFEGLIEILPEKV